MKRFKLSVLGGLALLLLAPVGIHGVVEPRADAAGRQCLKAADAFDDSAFQHKDVTQGRGTLAAIQQNLIWAFGYNVVAIPFAIIARGRHACEGDPADSNVVSCETVTGTRPDRR